MLNMFCNMFHKQALTSLAYSCRCYNEKMNKSLHVWLRSRNHVSHTF